jgi:SAM-dependent methyltransferase
MNAEFDGFAADYDDLLKDPLRDWFSPDGGFFVSRKVDVLLGLARTLGENTAQLTWLDVGCGKGGLLRAGRPHFRAAMGCDVSTAMIASCADLDVVLQQSTVAIPLPDESVDWVTAVCVYHHIDAGERRQLTADIHRVLRPGGICAVIEHNPLNPAVQVIIRRTPVDEHAALLTAGKTRRILRTAGFQIAATRYFLYLPQRIYPRAAAIEAALARLPLGGQYCVAARKADR